MKIRKAILADAKDIKSAWYHASQVNFRGYAPDNILEHLAFDDKAIQKQKELIILIYQKNQKELLDLHMLIRVTNILFLLKQNLI